LEEQNTNLCSRSTLDTLLATAHFAELSSSHRVGACNVLCGVLEQYVDSKDDEVRQLAFDQTTINRLLQVYLDRYDSGKSKAMKQVLNTLVRLLARTLDKGRVQYICSQCLDLAFFLRDRSKTKPALHALTVFLSRNVIEVSQLVAVFAEMKNNSSTNRNSFREKDISGLESSHGDLVSDLLHWIPTSDIAPAIGPLLSAICKQRDSEAEIARLGLPIWVEPVVRGMLSNPTEIQSYRYHAFPALLQSGLSGYLQFLEYLGFRKQLDLPVQASNVSQMAQTMFQRTGETRELMLFAALQAGKSCGVIQECSKFSYSREDDSPDRSRHTNEHSAGSPRECAADT
jgi:hypothetical protein